MKQLNDTRHTLGPEGGCLCLTMVIVSKKSHDIKNKVDWVFLGKNSVQLLMNKKCHKYNNILYYKNVYNRYYCTNNFL